MAMLMTNEVFARTWGERAGPAPAEEYWPALIGAREAAHPDLLFIAEAYWDMEWTLQQQGFDLCYDKRLYDRLAHESAEAVRGHLQADAGYQERLLRFIENHDEPRAAATFGPGQARAAAVAMSTLQGARLYHDGQLEGRRTHIPVFLGPRARRAAGRRSARVLRAAAARRRRLRPARRRLAAVRVRGLARQRLPSPARRLVLARPRTHATSSSSTSPTRPAQARVRLPWDDLAGRDLEADRPARTGERFERDGDELAADGLYVALDAWASHFLALIGDD